MLNFTSISDRNLHILKEEGLLTVDFVEIFLRYFETLIIQGTLTVLVVAELPVELTNKLAYGYTFGDLMGGYFMNSGFGVPLEDSVTRVTVSHRGRKVR